jgi:hypothetical protein
MKNNFCVFFFFLIACLDLRAEQPIVEKLQNELKTSYLNFLENEFGKCNDDLSTCLKKEDQYYRLSLPKKDLCFPYTVCGYYHCMEEKYKCSDVGVNYFTELAYPTCSQYVKNIDQNKFSEKGKEWIYSVMVCLQKGLTNECEVNENCGKGTQKATCDYIVDFTLKFHPGCYLNSGPGICRLPLSDKLAIWKTVAPFLTPRERQEAYKVIFYCATGTGPRP